MRNEDSCKVEHNEKNINDKHRFKRVIIRILLISIGSILTILIFVISYFLIYGYDDGIFDDHSNMYQVELPIEYPAKGGMIYLPNDWVFKEIDGWFYIYDTSSNQTIAYEMYHGFIINEKPFYDYESIDYCTNPNIPQEIEKNCAEIYNINYGKRMILESKNCYMLYIDDICSFKSPSLKNRKYTREYYFVKTMNLDLLKKIIRSYEMAKEVE